MANTKISALTSATTPLVGTEVLPIVQSSATVKVATNDLTVRNVRANATTGILQVTGPTAATTRVMTVPDANFTVARTDAAQSFTGDQTLSTGNLVIGTSGKGIDFSATPGTGTSELLADYEEGTFTATMTPETSGTITLETTVRTLVYTKVGRLVYVNGLLQVNSVSLPVGSYVSVTLPFVVINTGNQSRFGSASVVNQSGTYSNKVLLGVEGTSVVRLYITASTIASPDQFSFGFSYATT
jgi:hypothetical protein